MMLLALLLASLQEARTPVPEEADIRNAEKAIRALFRTDYSRRDKPSRKALAVKFLGQAASTKDDRDRLGNIGPPRGEPGRDQGG